MKSVSGPLLLAAHVKDVWAVGNEEMTGDVSLTALAKLTCTPLCIKEGMVGSQALTIKTNSAHTHTKRQRVFLYSSKANVISQVLPSSKTLHLFAHAVV